MLYVITMRLTVQNELMQTQSSLILDLGLKSLIKHFVSIHSWHGQGKTYGK